eukprot:6799263-Karenia_brevis.AAC.1
MALSSEQVQSLFTKIDGLTSTVEQIQSGLVKTNETVNSLAASFGALQTQIDTINSTAEATQKHISQLQTSTKEELE